MAKRNQLYLHKTKGYYVLLRGQLGNTGAWLVLSNWPEVAKRGPLTLAEASIKRSFTLVANNYQPH